MQRNILILLVALSVALGATAVTAADHATVEVDQEPDEPATVTVTNVDDESVENASVTVERADDNQPAYNGTGNYTTDANGTVELPAPAETVDVVVTATVDNETVSTEATLEALPELDLSVEQSPGQPATVTVTADGEPVENASVDAETVDENATYVGANETYTTDENGTVQLPAPNETVAVTVTAELDGASATTDAVLEAAPDLNVSVDQDGPGLPATVTVLADDEAAENASVDVDLAETENASYAGTGEYDTDENGTVELPAPEETVNVSLTVTYQGAKETVMATIEGVDAIDEDLPFGQQLQQFKATLDEDADTGREIASWVVDNNPGNAPDHAGPKNATGNEGAGPPAHANGNDDAESDDETETDDDAESDDETETDDDTESDGDVGTNDDTESDDAGSSGNGGGNGNAGGNNGNGNRGGNGNAGGNNGNGNRGGN